MKNTIISLLLLLLAVSSCNSNDEPLPSGDMPLKYVDYCTIEGDGKSDFVFHGDDSPLYLKLTVAPSSSLSTLVESGVRRVQAAFELPKSFDTSPINQVDTVVVKNSVLLQLVPVETHDILSAMEADVAGVSSTDNTHIPSAIDAKGCRGFITLKGVYGYMVNSSDKTPVKVYMYVDESRCKSDVLALQLVYTREDIDGYDLLRYDARTDCFALKSLKSRYGSLSSVKVEIRSRGNLMTTLNLLGSDFTSPID